MSNMTEIILAIVNVICAVAFIFLIHSNYKLIKSRSKNNEMLKQYIDLIAEHNSLIRKSRRLDSEFDGEMVEGIVNNYDRLADKVNELIKEHNRIICRLDQFKRGRMLHIQKYEK